MRRRRWFLVASLVGVIAIAGLAAGVAGGPPSGLYRLSGLFGQVLAMVRTSYVEEVSVARLAVGAMNGLVSEADPGGAWIPDEEFASFEAMKQEPLPAFGVLLGRRASYPVVLQVLPGSPAERAGLLPGEMLETIDGEALRARPLWLAERQLVAAAKETRRVKVEVIDRWLRGKRSVILEPAAVTLAPPLVETSDGVVVIRPVAAVDETVRLVRERLERLADTIGVVVDLRGVALGDRRTAVELAAVVAGGEVVVPLANRAGAAGTLRARGAKRPWRVVACLDATTAAAGEVAALAFKQAGGTLVGGRSYGDTGERRAVPVRGGRLWLAQSWCVGPDGQGIIGRGLAPDEVVRLREGDDPVLARAKELARAGAARQAA